MATDNIRRYTAAESAVFRRTRDQWGELSNFAPCLIEINGLRAYHSEALYQAGRFTAYRKGQIMVCAQRNPMTAKRTAHKHIQHTRPDWRRINVRLMRWVLRVKLLQNPQVFGRVLMETGDRPIVEYSVRDGFWGAAMDGDQLVGVNALGRLLMELRQEARDGDAAHATVDAPNIPDFLINGKEVPVLGAGGGVGQPETKIVNIHHNRDFDIYIGRPRKGARPNKLGNPFEIGPGMTRAEAIRRFEVWLRDEIAAGQYTLGFIANLHGKTLGCFCVPAECHGQVWAYYAAWAYRKVAAGEADMTLPEPMLAAA